MNKRSKILSLMLVLSGFLVACGGDTEEVNSVNSKVNDSNLIDPIQVKTTLFALEDFTSRIGGDYVEVVNIVPIGADAHTFEPTANQMIDVANADLFIFSSKDFEGFAESVEDAVADHDVTVLEASHGIDLIGFDHDHGGETDDAIQNNEDDHGQNDNDDHNHGDNNEDNHGHNDEDDNNDHESEDLDHPHDDEDPHVWLDPIRAIEYADNIKRALIDVRPDAKEEFIMNFEELKLELEELDIEFKEMAEEAKRDTIIVSHAGYGYWENRYSIHQVGISGLSPTNEPSIQQVQDVIKLMENEEMNYVMFEQNIPMNIAETVREQVGAEDLWLHNLEVLTEDDLENGEDYFSLMRRNIETLRTALQ